MYRFKSQILIFMSTIMLLLNTSCGGSSEDSEDSPSSNDSPPATMQTNMDNQNQLEEEATSSLDTSTVEGSFEFGTQRVLLIDLQFANTIFNEKIAIYSTIDVDSNSPTNLLEQGTIIQSSSYKTIVYIASEFNSLIIVRNDNISAFTELAISASGQVTHFFEE